MIIINTLDRIPQKTLDELEELGVQILRSPRAMEEYLTQKYYNILLMGNGGHATGFVKPTEEKIRDRYEFPSGVFSIRSREVYGDKEVVHFNYDPKENQ
jgi:hypothetical protein